MEAGHGGGGVEGAGWCLWFYRNIPIVPFEIRKVARILGGVIVYVLIGQDLSTGLCE